MKTIPTTTLQQPSDKEDNVISIEAEDHIIDISNDFNAKATSVVKELDPVKEADKNVTIDNNDDKADNVAKDINSQETSFNLAASDNQPLKARSAETDKMLGVEVGVTFMALLCLILLFNHFVSIINFSNNLFMDSVSPIYFIVFIQNQFALNSFLIKLSRMLKKTKAKWWRMENAVSLCKRHWHFWGAQ